MSSTIGQPLMGYPVRTGDTNYLNLGCGDVVSSSSSPGTATCPVHGTQVVIHASGIINDGTSVARSC
jgi:hypothetical protein